MAPEQQVECLNQFFSVDISGMKNPSAYLCGLARDMNGKRRRGPSHSEHDLESSRITKRLEAMYRACAPLPPHPHPLTYCTASHSRVLRCQPLASHSRALRCELLASHSRAPHCQPSARPLCGLPRRLQLTVACGYRGVLKRGDIDEQLIQNLHDGDLDIALKALDLFAAKVPPDCRNRSAYLTAQLKLAREEPNRSNAPRPKAPEGGARQPRLGAQPGPRPPGFPSVPGMVPPGMMMAPMRPGMLPPGMMVPPGMMMPGMMTPGGLMAPPHMRAAMAMQMGVPQPPTAPPPADAASSGDPAPAATATTATADSSNFSDAQKAAGVRIDVRALYYLPFLSCLPFLPASLPSSFSFLPAVSAGLALFLPTSFFPLLLLSCFNCLSYLPFPAVSCKPCVSKHPCLRERERERESSCSRALSIGVPECRGFISAVCTPSTCTRTPRGSCRTCSTKASHS